MSKASHTEFFQFLFVGGIAAAINFISRIGFNEFFSYRISIVLAYIIGMIVAFTLFKHYVNSFLVIIFTVGVSLLLTPMDVSGEFPIQLKAKTRQLVE